MAKLVITVPAGPINVEDRLENVRTHHAEVRHALPTLVKSAFTRRADGVQVCRAVCSERCWLHLALFRRCY